ncbi:UDP-N-acetylmuramoyl-L-alanyl-D-glutamate--2,6-diaminopimelate ligase [Dinghuibacter silviterrae]|uniref:UDP-N-acetylmuramoyl-L-alanyl-D-glutamate--2,6-diaminopimelate ligase n=1 Tax=Dinghuibacter silviterrae TaxID=1539049 RepID=A0A4R8DQ46_9BACT|nr:UDP-N-acetylmuramoyl-L-alanyl-D-glutamate--2,6-diaminopimelate ligase [Dinghuibacter silviterrae]TDX00244.1 UDP-N-acetylmuramoylalanyl-D-glutamate--2,6-diaminopimelate ligase [Dinghuibacter silviterrae]
MRILQDILYKVNILEVRGDTGREVLSLTLDSRKAEVGGCFIAVKGTLSDGHKFIPMALDKGAVVVVCEVMPEEQRPGVTYVQVRDSAAAAGQMAHQFYGEPSAHLTLVGVTGTNGKTTVATLLYKLFTGLGYTCGLLSTVQNEIAGRVVAATHTTPDPIELNALLADMVAAGCTHAFMEVSSHAIHQQRVAGLVFAGGIFTNITHDHLDYHKTFDEYIRVKKSFFDNLPATAFALSNADDKRGTVMLQNTPARKAYYSLRTLAEVKGKILENELTGLVMVVDDIEVHFRLIGEFNAYNLLAVYGAAVALGEDKTTVLQVLSTLTGAEGRFDYIVSPVDRIMGIVDYAHTPDALLNVLSTLQKLRKGGEKIITVVGAGGDRDKTKRPVMAEVACEHSDRVILTADNPRSEDPMDILRDMESGLGSAAKRKYLVVPDRTEAIKTAITLAGKGDIILVAGKGHEKYQEIKGVKHPFDDKAILKELFALLEK